MCKNCNPHTAPLIKCDRTPMREMTEETMLASFPGLSPAMAAWWLSPQGGNLATSSLTLGEFLTNRCSDCGEIIKVYPRSESSWRVNLHPIRCKSCAAEVRRLSHGEYGDWDSLYVA